MKPLAGKVGRQEADRRDDEQPKQEAEALMVLNEAYHANTIALPVKHRMLMGPGCSVHFQ